jgi:phosphinothricin acetyltransferase
MESLAIRLATPADLPAINELYNHYVIHSTCTYQTEPETLEARRNWFERHSAKHPVTVATRGEVVVGWASLSRFHSRAAYANTVENSIYVHHEWHRQGIGGALLDDLIVRARQIGHHTILAGIDAEQAGSLAIHASRGFTEVAHLKQVGYKFSRWLDVIYMQLLFA